MSAVVIRDAVPQDAVASIALRKAIFGETDFLLYAPDEYVATPATFLLGLVQVLSQSEDSWEDAARRAVKDAGKSVKKIKSIYIKNQEAVVKGNKIVQYRINANITIELE